MEVQLITAPGDGVSPALILTMGHKLKGQYLFNVPEGFSRFVLEHKVRPTLNLRAVFATDPSAVLGLGGLIMRLRGEGHGHVHLLGPLGVQASLTSLRHFIHWQHPQVKVSELVPLESLEVYSDEHIAVSALWQPPLVDALWSAPIWLQHAQPKQINNTIVNDANGLSSSSSDDSSTSSSESNSAVDNEQSSSGTSMSTDNDNGSDSDSNKNDNPSKQQQPVIEAAPSGGLNTPSFDDLDKLFMIRGGGLTARSQILSHLTAPRNANNSIHASNTGGASNAASNAQTSQRQFIPYEQPGISVAIEQKVATMTSHQQQQQQISGMSNTKPRKDTNLLAYVCHMKATDRLLLITRLHTNADVNQLLRHPAVELIQKTGAARVAGVIHMLSSGLTKSKPFKKLIELLPGSHYVLQAPGPFSPDIGYLASGRVSMRLNLVSSRVFPLPSALRSKLQEQRQNEKKKKTEQADEAPETINSVSDKVKYIKNLTSIVWSVGDVTKQQPGSTAPVMVQPDEAFTQPVDVKAFQDEIRATTAPELTDLLKPLDSSKFNAALPNVSVPPSLGSIDTAIGAVLMHNNADGDGSGGGSCSQTQFPPFLQPLYALADAWNSGGNTSKDPSSYQLGNKRLHPQVDMPSNKKAAQVLKARLQAKREGEGGPLKEQTSLQEDQEEDTDSDDETSRNPTSSAFIPVALDSSVRKLANQIHHQSVQLQHPQVTFLGTGSAEPSKYRGASAILLTLPTGHSVMMDCGEGAFGQLVRLHGFAAAKKMVASLAFVWISHRHADHMSGVPSLLAAYPSNQPPLLLIGPHSLASWLSDLTPALHLKYRFVHCTDINRPDHWVHGLLCAHLSMHSICSVPVRHCSDAHALILRHRAGWGVAYSGDTQPCETFIRAAQGITLLIHEATFHPGLQAEAAKKRHSTTEEAVWVATRMGAAHTILTHFSQRYPKFPEGVEAGGEGPIVAFDGMCVPFELLRELPKLMPAVERVLQSDQQQAGE